MYKVKRFSYKDIPYPTKFQRARAALGAGAGAYLGLRSTSKKSIDEINKRNKSYHEKIERILSNPSNYLSDMMSYSKVAKQLTSIEKENDIKLPSELYKLAKVNDKFIPIASKWMKSNRRFLPSEIYLINAEIIRNELKFTENYNNGVIILINNEMADDTYIYIVWYPESNAYSYEAMQSGKGEFKTLKSILMDHMSSEIKYGEDMSSTDVDILIKYRDLIKSNL